MLGPRAKTVAVLPRVRRRLADLRASGHAKPLALRRASGLGRAGQYVLSPLDRDAHDASARALPHRRRGASLPGAVQILSRGVRRAFADGVAVRGTESGACGVGRACGTVALEFGLGTSAEAVRQTALVGAADRTGVAAAVAPLGQPATNGRGAKGPPRLHPAKLSLRGRNVGQQQCRAVEPGEHPPSTWKAQKRGRLVFPDRVGTAIEDQAVPLTTSPHDSPNQGIVDARYPHGKAVVIRDEFRKAGAWRTMQPVGNRRNPPRLRRTTTRDELEG